tara:strand:+ start:20395 stop:22893 length:2499 start_codon:yes stop_codon:yes gene_type:complete
MGTTLEGKQINQTYQGLLKTTDNTEVSATAKEITDGKGNGTGVTLDNSGNLVATATVTANAFVGDGSGLTNLPAAAVLSVNSQIGAVVLDTDDIAQGSTNEYYTDAKVSANADVVANTSKVGITTEQSNAIVSNTAKVGITPTQASEISANTLKAGITTDQANEIAANTLKTGITTEQSNAIVANTAKTGITVQQASDIQTNNSKVGITSEQATAITNNTAKVGITTQQAADITSNNAKVTRRPIIAGGNTLDISETLTITAGTNVTVTEVDGTVTIASTGGASGVTSVNTQTGDVVLDTDDISEGTNKYTTAANLTKLGHISVTQAVDLDTMESDIATNNSKVGISTQQAADIVTNNAKVSYPSTDSTKVGFISITQAVDLDTIESDVTTNNAKVGITAQQASDITANNAKIGITTQQANDITANNAKVSMVIGTTAGTALEGDTELLQLGTTSTTALAGDTTTITAQQAADITTNNSKVGITTGQADAIVANTAKTGITTEQANAIIANTDKVGITTQQASDITTNNAKVGITAQQSSDITTNNAKISYPSADSTKVSFISVTQAVDLDTIESDVATNNAKTGITAQQTSDIITNNAKVGITTQQAADIVTNNAKVGITTQQASDITTNNAKISFDSTSSTKLGTIAEGAEVNVNADWSATTGDAFIQNKPTLATVATSGAYSDLSGTPSLASVATSGDYDDLDNTPTLITNNNQLINGAGYTTNVGTVTNVTVGTGLDVTSGTTTPSLSLDLSEFTDMTADMVGTDEFIVLDSSSERRKAANEIESTILNLEKQSNAIGNAIDFSARVTLDGGVAEGTSTMIKNLQNIL